MLLATLAVLAQLPQISQGLMGYISMDVQSTPEGFGQGVSFYTPVWPLLEKPLASFQIGLPSIWIVPDNRGFEEPLCPVGTIPRDQWPERGPSYRDVFQTIEGGLGFWGSTQFGSPSAKFRMNGTPNCYSDEISSPGFGFGKPEALKAEQLGLAQLSNRLVVPPDGLTFAPGTNGELFGNAWMALALLQQPGTGPQCWTLFVRAANFEGALAFWTPRTWTRIADKYPTAAGRGLDARPGLAGGGAMEINTVPMFAATDARGRRYTRIPRLSFPVDREGNTVMMQDFTLYSAGVFDAQTARVPDCKTNPISLHQGPDNTPLAGIGAAVETVMLGPGSFGLRWKNAKGTGNFPEYFGEEGQTMVALAAEKVPPETHLREQHFAPAATGASYVSPEQPGASVTVKLSDGSKLTYRWYRFVDQPSIRALDLPQAERERLQAAVERLHLGSLPAPSRGKLATLDAALLVVPPAGMEVGYVPIATRQDPR